MTTPRELFVANGPYNPGAITLADAIDVMATTLPEFGSFRQALRTAADRIRTLETRAEQAADWVRAVEFHAPSDTAAWGTCPECGHSQKHGHDEGCSLAAWLAGCKP